MNEKYEQRALFIDVKLLTVWAWKFGHCYSTVVSAVMGTDVGVVLLYAVILYYLKKEFITNKMRKNGSNVFC